MPQADIQVVGEEILKPGQVDRQIKTGQLEGCWTHGKPSDRCILEGRSRVYPSAYFLVSQQSSGPRAARGDDASADRSYHCMSLRDSEDVEVAESMLRTIADLDASRKISASTLPAGAWESVISEGLKVLVPYVNLLFCQVAFLSEIPFVAMDRGCGMDADRTGG